MLVQIALPHQAGVQRGDFARFLVAGLRVALVHDRHVPDAAGGQRVRSVRAQHQALARGRFRGAQPAVVDGVRNEAADRGVHAIGRVQKDAAISRDGGVAVQKVFQRGFARAAGMRALGRLAKLHLVAQQHDVARALAQRDQIRQADLPGFIHEQIIELLLEISPAEQPRRARHQLMARQVDPVVGKDVFDEVAVETGVVALLARLLGAGERQARLARRLLQAGQQVVDGVMAVGRDRDALALAQQVHQHARAGVGLARAGWALQEEGGLVHAADDVHHLIQQRRARVGQRGAGRYAVNARRLVLEQRIHRAERRAGAIVRGEQRVAVAEHGVGQFVDADRPARPERQALRRRRLARQGEGGDAGRRIHRQPADRRPAAHVRTGRPGAQLGLLRGKPVGVAQRLRHRFGRHSVIAHQSGQAFVVFHQFGIGRLHAGEHGPPFRLLFAAMKIQQLVDQRAIAVAR